MSRIAKELSALEVGRLNKPGTYAVGGVLGLHLQIIGGSKSWILRTTVGNKRRRMGLGSYPTVTLARAREKAREAHAKIDDGADPILERQQAKSALRAKQAKALTFDEACRKFIDARSDEWRNSKHRQQWINTLDTYASPVMGKLLVQDVDKEHILQVLEPIWKAKTETASRLRGRIESVLDWATARGHREGLNPARWRGHLDKLLAKPEKITKVEHHAALSVDAVPGFVSALRQRDGTSARALEFTILTAARSGEVRGAKWSEIDIEKAVWTVPAERMKAEKEHRVPLSIQAVELLKALPRIRDNDLVFPAPMGGMLSDMALTAVTRRMEAPCVPHGFRSSFRDWASERTNFPRDVAEMALAHAIGDKTEAAYRRGDLFDKRRLMMAAWAAFCETPPAVGSTVVPIHKAA